MKKFILMVLILSICGYSKTRTDTLVATNGSELVVKDSTKFLGGLRSLRLYTPQAKIDSLVGDVKVGGNVTMVGLLIFGSSLQGTPDRVFYSDAEPDTFTSNGALIMDSINVPGGFFNSKRIMYIEVTLNYAGTYITNMCPLAFKIIQSGTTYLCDTVKGQQDHENQHKYTAQINADGTKIKTRLTQEVKFNGADYVNSYIKTNVTSSGFNGSNAFTIKITKFDTDSVIVNTRYVKIIGDY